MPTKRVRKYPEARKGFVVLHIVISPEDKALFDEVFKFVYENYLFSSRGLLFYNLVKYLMKTTDNASNLAEWLEIWEQEARLPKTQNFSEKGFRDLRLKVPEHFNDFDWLCEKLHKLGFRTKSELGVKIINYACKKYGCNLRFWQNVATWWQER